MALLDSASSGRGLSEIAVYRESTPFNEAHDSEPSSPARSASLDDEAADKTDEYNEEGPDENGPNEEDAHDDHGADETAEFEDDFESKSIGAAEAATLEETKSTGDFSGNSAEADKENTNPKPEDDLLDFSDEELDLSPSKEGKHPHRLTTSHFFTCTGTGDCQCDDCFQVELERLDASWRLGSDNAWPPTGNTQTESRSLELVTRGRETSTQPTPGSSDDDTIVLPHSRPSIKFRLDTNTHSYQDRSVQSPLEDKGARSAEDPTSHEVDVKVTGGHGPSATSPNGHLEAPISDYTSATATLNGDDRDEIDYSDDEDVSHKDEVTINAEKAHVPGSPKASNDEEITWESDTEETKTPRKGASTSNGTIQVSSPHNKRSRSESDDVDGEGEQIGML